MEELAKALKSPFFSFFPPISITVDGIVSTLSSLQIYIMSSLIRRLSAKFLFKWPPCYTENEFSSRARRRCKKGRGSAPQNVMEIKEDEDYARQFYGASENFFNKLF